MNYEKTLRDILRNTAHHPDPAYFLKNTVIYLIELYSLNIYNFLIHQSDLNKVFFFNKMKHGISSTELNGTYNPSMIITWKCCLLSERN